MGKYALMKRFYHCHRLQVYMYAFMYINTEIIPVEDYFPATKTFFEIYKNISTPVPTSKHWIGLSFIGSENHELDLNFDETEMKMKSDHTSNDKVELFRENILIIE